MFVFFDFFTPIFKKLWINRPNHLSYAPARLPKYAGRGAFLVAGESVEVPALICCLCLQPYVAANYRSK